ncbi:MAG: acyl carrier protein [Bacteroidia bacterium]|nr:acyl carrier protein [Bacteroidia bacterium]
MNLERKILSIIKANIEYKGEITLDSNLIQDLDIDSFNMLMLINAIEDEFSIQVDEADFEKLKIVSDIIEVLKSKYL